MFGLLGSLVSYIPGLSKAISGLAKLGLQVYDAHLQAQGAHEDRVSQLAQKEIDLSATEAQLAQQQKALTIGKWTEPEHLLGYILVAWLGKVILWDNVIGSLFGYDPAWLFYTHLLKPTTEVAMERILTFWVGARMGIAGLRTLISGWKL